MEGIRPQAVPRCLPGVLTTAAVTVAVLAHTTGNAAARSGHGSSGGDASGWADPRGYHVAVEEPETRPGAPPAHQKPTGSKNVAEPQHLTYCEAAVVGARTVDPLAPAPPGTPVDCATGQTTLGVTPQELAQRAWSDLRLPLPDVRTAPPRGSAGLVGLPEWVWVPRGQWRPQSKQASAGGVWARVTATPERLTIKPGGGLAAVTCRGPGVAYDPVKPASAQRTDCSVTYARSSASAPGAVYRVTVTVTWAGSWTGTGGAGGALPEVRRSATFGLAVAEAQGLYG